MRFNTHERMPKEQAATTEKIILGVVILLLCSFFAVLSWAVFKSEGVALLAKMWACILLIFCLAAVLLTDVTRAYVEVVGETITTVDYYFFIKREKQFDRRDVCRAAVWSRSSEWIRGYALKGKYYIIFRDQNGKYLFKVLACPETVRFFEDFTKLKIN